MATTTSLGQFEQLLLSAILMLPDDAYGVTIHAKVSELAHPRKVAMGAIYVSLDRLETKNLVTSWLTDPTPQRGGRAKRCYRVEAAGEEALKDSAATSKRIWDGLIEVWGRDWVTDWRKRMEQEAGA